VSAVCAGGHESPGQWAETSHCRVAGVSHHGTFTALDLTAPRIATKASPGQFVMVAVPGGGFLLRRPLSLFSVRGERVGLLIERRGAGTERLVSLAVGDAVDLAGPLGSAFPIDGVSDALLVGGGIGCAPLQYLSDALAAAGSAVTAVFGFRDQRAARVAHAFSISRLLIASEDGSVGQRGTVLDALRDLEVRPGTTAYVCGPSGMIAAVQDWCARLGLRGYASLEAHMACGTGACHGCVVDTAQGRLRVCSEGPVFALEDVRP